MKTIIGTFALIGLLAHATFAAAQTDAPIRVHLKPIEAAAGGFVDPATVGRRDATKDLHEIMTGKKRKSITYVETPADAQVLVEVLARGEGDNGKESRTWDGRTQKDKGKWITVRVTVGTHSTEMTTDVSTDPLGLWSSTAVQAFGMIEKWIKTNRAAILTAAAQ